MAQSRPAESSGTAPAWAWSLCWLMFASTVLNYMDRQAIALVGPQIQQEFAINNTTFGWVMAAFTLTYALLQVPAGLMADRLDVRWLYLGAVVWWSLAGVASAFAPTLGILIACRALLGVGESFNWPCALKVTGRILPVADRGLGNGIFNSGAAVGAVITPLIVPFVTVRYGWRTAFVAVGLLGFAWALVWLMAVRGQAAARLAAPGQTRSSSASALSLKALALVAFMLLILIALVAGIVGYLQLGAIGCWLGVATLMIGLLIMALLLPLMRALVAFMLLILIALAVGFVGCLQLGAIGCWLGVATLMIGLLIVARLLPLDSLGENGWGRSLGEVVRLRRFWVMVAVAISINICWHFLVSWLPKYLDSERKMTALVSLFDGFLAADDPERQKTASFLVSSVVTAFIFLAADAGNLLGGLGSRLLAGRGLKPAQARLRVMAVCVLLISAGAWVGRVGNDYAAMALLGLMALGAAAFMANYFAFCQEVDPAATGLVVGILGGLGNLFAAAILPFAGWVKDTSGSFGPIFVLVGLSPIIGVLALALLWGSDPDQEPTPSQPN